MFLSYIGNGKRQYSKKKPTWKGRILTRNVWEFEAVIRGEIGILFPEGPDILHAQSLWVFPPQHTHGWVGNKEREAEIAVFHFQTVPPFVEHYCRNSDENYICISLTPAQCRQLRAWADLAVYHRQNPSRASIICYQHILSGLSLMVHESELSKQQASTSTHAQRCVDRAMQWYSEHMAEDPDYDTIVRAAGVSASHLRRLFHQIMGLPPQKVFERLRFERATQLMSDPDIKLTEIAEASGFQSASVFSRAFKSFFGCSPAVWSGRFQPRHEKQP
ncbi:MAG: AraC family transcriptional regulator [Kiritimatiellales bacterium]